MARLLPEIPTMHMKHIIINLNIVQYWQGFRPVLNRIDVSWGAKAYVCRRKFIYYAAVETNIVLLDNNTKRGSHCLFLTGMDFLATKGNHDANCNEGSGDADGCKKNNNRCNNDRNNFTIFSGLAVPTPFPYPCRGRIISVSSSVPQMTTCFIVCRDSWDGGLWDGKKGYKHYYQRLSKEIPTSADCWGTYGTDYGAPTCRYCTTWQQSGIENLDPLVVTLWGWLVCGCGISLQLWSYILGVQLSWSRSSWRKCRKESQAC